MDLVAERLTAQLLAGRRPRDPVAVVERLLAVQGQDPRGVRLAIRARSVGVTAADVDRALTDDRSLLITWLNRRTLHLVRSEDYPFLQALTAPQLATGTARRLEQEGVSPAGAERAVAAVEKALAEDGPLTRAQIRKRVASARVRTEGQALVNVLLLASLRGLIVRGPMVGKEQAFVLVRDWLGEQPKVDRERALAELARRYLAGHGPAGERDLARWAGLPLRDVRAGFSAIAGELATRSDGLVELKRRRRPAALPPPRLLGAFEPVLLGWIDRTPLVGTKQAAITVGGLFKPFALVEGRAVGTWRLVGGEVELERFGRIPRDVLTALDADGEDVVRFLASRD
jgi:DNA glycosylase AlkZ-like